MPRVGRGPQPLLQSERSECGLACLAMVVAHHARRTSTWMGRAPTAPALLAEMRARFPHHTRGLRLRDLLGAAGSLGLTARALHVPADRLREFGGPTILHWGFNHFVVLDRVRVGRARVLDPARGVQWIDMRRLAELYTGVAVELTPAADIKARLSNLCGERRRTEQTAELSAMPSPALVIPYVALATFAILATVSLPLVIQFLIDDVITKGDAQLLPTALAMLLAALLLAAVGERAQQLFLARRSGRVRFGFLDHYLDHLIHLPWAYFDRRSLGTFVAQHAALSRLTDVHVRTVGAVISDGLFTITLSLVLLAIAPLPALVVLAVNGGIMVSRVSMVRRVRNLQSTAIEAAAEEEAHFVATLRGIGTVKSSALEGVRLSSQLDQTARLTNANYQVARFETNFTFAMRTVRAIETAAVLGMLAWLVMNAALTIGTFYAFFALKQRLDERIGSLVNATDDLLASRIYLDRANEPLRERTESAEPSVSDHHALLGDVTVERLSHAVDSGSDLIDGLSIEIPAGSFVLVTGLSGSGKTTLLRLLLGQIEPERGSVRHDGLSMSPALRRMIRASVGSVMQEDALFAGSIAENVAAFSDVIDHERLAVACEKACILEEIRAMPLGVETIVRDMGTNFSTGQRQRILIARAFYKQPTLFVLDEGTANLNPDVEARILENLRSEGRTVLFASHSAAVAGKAEITIDLSRQAVGA